jgi:tRNA G10  N-methylase Trm11
VRLCWFVWYVLCSSRKGSTNKKQFAYYFLNEKEKANDWFNNDETHRDVYSKKSQEYLEIVATNKTPIWDSEQKKFVAEEDKEEKETASLTDEINMMRTETSKSFESEYDGADEDTDFGVTSLDSDDDELPF